MDDASNRKGFEGFRLCVTKWLHGRRLAPWVAGIKLASIAVVRGVWYARRDQNELVKEQKETELTEDAEYLHAPRRTRIPLPLFRKTACCMLACGSRRAHNRLSRRRPSLLHHPVLAARSPRRDCTLTRHHLRPRSPSEANAQSTSASASAPPLAKSS